MREFKHLRSELGRFVVGPVQNIELQLDGGQPVTEFGVLGCKRRLVDFVGQPDVQQTVLLGRQERRLPRQFFPLGAGVRLGISCLGGKDSPEPVAHVRIFDFHAAEEFNHL